MLCKAMVGMRIDDMEVKKVLTAELFLKCGIEWVKRYKKLQI